MRENERSSRFVSGRKGATAAAVVLAVILSLAIGGGASWFFLAGAEAQAREALRQAQEEQRRQSKQALAQLREEIQGNLERAAEELKRLNYGSGLEELQEAIDKCDLVMNTLVEEDAAQARLIKEVLEQGKGLSQAGDPAVLEQVKRLQRGEVSPAPGRPEATVQPQPRKAMVQPEGKVGPAVEGAPPEAPPLEGEEGRAVPEQPAAPPPTAVEPQVPAPPPFAP